ncbi:MAG: hypothetical protein QOE25_823, partial [Actinomycetota bacterium]|nr:hypothetical protein [Actinomycetota bacterium]
MTEAVGGKRFRAATATFDREAE